MEVSTLESIFYIEIWTKKSCCWKFQSEKFCIHEKNCSKLSPRLLLRIHANVPSRVWWKKFNKKEQQRETEHIQPFPSFSIFLASFQIPSPFFSFHYPKKKKVSLLLLITFRQGNDMKIMEIHFSFFLPFSAIASGERSRSEAEKLFWSRLYNLEKRNFCAQSRWESCWLPRRGEEEEDDEKIEEGKSTQSTMMKFFVFVLMLWLWCRLTWDNIESAAARIELHKKKIRWAISNPNKKYLSTKSRLKKNFSIFKMSLTLPLFIFFGHGWHTRAAASSAIVLKIPIAFWWVGSQRELGNSSPFTWIHTTTATRNLRSDFSLHRIRLSLAFLGWGSLIQWHRQRQQKKLRATLRWVARESKKFRLKVFHVSLDVESQLRLIEQVFSVFAGVLLCSRVHARENSIFRNIKSRLKCAMMMRDLRY